MNLSRMYEELSSLGFECVYDSGKTWTGRASVSFTHTTPTEGNEEKTDQRFNTMCQKLGTL